MREVRRLINLLLKIKRDAWQMEGTPVGTPALQLLERYAWQMETSGEKRLSMMYQKLKGLAV